MPLTFDRWTPACYSARLISVGQFRTAKRSCPAGRRGAGASDVPPFAGDVSTGPRAAVCPRLAFEIQARLRNRQPSRPVWRTGSLESHFGHSLAEMSIVVRLHNVIFPSRLPINDAPSVRRRSKSRGFVSG